ncbi:multiple epidermal growth factor-like domains protein 10, partial [Biomphalaria glabrata]
CNEMTYGQSCSKICSTNCTDQKCDPVNGKCNVCIPGYKGDFCNQTCSEKTYGQNCSLNCSSKCTDQKCDPVYGKCNVCIPGYKGDFCNQ